MLSVKPVLASIKRDCSECTQLDLHVPVSYFFPKI